MKKSDLIFMSMGNLWRRKLRTVLTLLGVVIGTTSIIVMISLGVGMKQSIDSQLKEMGSLNIITVTKRYDYQKPNDNNNKKKVLLNDEAVETLSQIPGVDAASPVKSIAVMLRRGKYYAYARVTGIKRELMALQNPQLAEGELFKEDERYSFLIGGEIPYQFRDPKARGRGEYDNDMMEGAYYYGGDEQQKRPDPKVNVMTEPLLLNPDTRYGEPDVSYEDRQTIPRPIKISISGLLKSGNWNTDYSIYTSLETVDKIQKDYEKWKKKMQQRNPDQQQPDTSSKSTDKRKQEYEQVQLFVGDTKKILEIQANIRKMGYDASSMIQMVEQLNQFTNIAQMVLGGIGGVSLIVAAIGISNTMVMSIYERTKEIGVMKVIGASLEDIQGMFLTEAALIGLIGGIVGLIFSTGGSMILNFLTKGMNIFGGRSMDGNTPPLSVIPLWLYLLGMIFTTGVGLVSGYLPARRAMKLSVLKALRNE